MEATDAALAPIALLIDSLRSADPTSRLASVKRLSTIAVALGEHVLRPSAYAQRE